MVLSLAACGKTDQPTETIPSTEAPKPEVVDDALKAKFDEIVTQSNYQGIVYLTHNGQVVYQSVSGNNDLGDPLTIDSPMFICSMSKQFCAATILMLRDQGKLSLDDTLGKYFPEYIIGKDITLHQVLSMRSGICRDVDPMLNHPENYENNSFDENVALFKEYVFSQPLLFEPDTDCAYSNNGYRLLSLIVEQVSGMAYEDFIRQNIFEPVGMTHSGFKREVPEHPEWGLTYDNIHATGQILILAQGAGGIVSTAEDMDKWMTALQDGKVICEESYKQMTTNYSADVATTYGYGLTSGIRGGWGHDGGNGGYTSRTRYNTELGYNIFVATNANPANKNPTITVGDAILRELLNAIDASI